MTLGKIEGLWLRTTAGRELLDLFKVFQLHFDVRYFFTQRASLLSCQRGMCVSIRLTLAGLPASGWGLDVVDQWCSMAVMEQFSEHFIGWMLYFEEVLFALANC